jgi:hypothetical protein
MKMTKLYDLNGKRTSVKQAVQTLAGKPFYQTLTAAGIKSLLTQGRVPGYTVK